MRVRVRVTHKGMCKISHIQARARIGINLYAYHGDEFHELFSNFKVRVIDELRGVTAAVMVHLE